MELFDPTRHPIQRGIEEGVGIACQQALGQITGLGEEKPMEGTVGKLPVHRWPDVERRHHGEGTVGTDMLWIIQREPVSDPRASIVANDGEAVMAEQPHHGHEFVARGPLVPRPGVEHPALPISRQVGRDDGEMFRQCRANLMPGHVALGIAMQQ